MKDLFKRLISNNKLAHSYIFFGNNLNQIFEFSQWITKELGSDNFFSDLIKIESTDGSIGIDKIREGKSFLYKKPIYSSRKILIIKKAEDLTTEAQNAILKISEEPPKHTLIILITTNYELLLPTIISRMQRIYFPVIGFVNNSDQQNLIKKSAQEYLKANPGTRKEIIEQILEKNNLDEFIKFLIIELSYDKIKNWQLLKELFHRWHLINQFNLNKKLQMEAFSSLLL